MRVLSAFVVSLFLASSLATVSASAQTASLIPAPVPASAPAPAQRLGVPQSIELAQATAKAPQRPAAAVRSQTASDQANKDRINAWTVGLAAGRIEGAPLTFASELARVLDDGDNMRVLPIVTRGPFDNVFDLLYLRGVDAAIVYGDVLDYFKNKPEFASSWRRINYLLSLFPSEAHVFVRPEIKSIQDLAGKVVNFNTQGTAAAYSGPIIFRQLGIDIKAAFMPHSVAMGKMKESNEVAATFWISSKPLAPFLKGKWPDGFKFVPIEYSEKLEYYTPAYLENADYPALIPKDQRIATVSVAAVLAVYDWPKDTDRYQRLNRLIEYLMDRFDRLQKEPGYHEKWKDVNLAATVPGWQRFKPLQDRLDKLAETSSRIDPAQARAQAARAAPHDVAEQERLFRQFLEWNKKQSKQ